MFARISRRTVLQSVRVSKLSSPIKPTFQNSRSFSAFLDLDDDLDRWPRAQLNTFLNVCPQGMTICAQFVIDFNS